MNLIILYHREKKEAWHHLDLPLFIVLQEIQIFNIILPKLCLKVLYPRLTTRIIRQHHQDKQVLESKKRMKKILQLCVLYCRALKTK